ncbi:hypothetical protein GCM10025738_08140 [Microbacterium fluvii]
MARVEQEQRVGDDPERREHRDEHEQGRGLAHTHGAPVAIESRQMGSSLCWDRHPVPPDQMISAAQVSATPVCEGDDRPAALPETSMRAAAHPRCSARVNAA